MRALLPLLLPFASALLHKKTTRFLVDPNTMGLLYGDGPAAGQIESIHQSSTGGAQQHVFESAFHLGDDQRRHDSNESEYYHQFD